MDTLGPPLEPHGRSRLVDLAIVILPLLRPLRLLRLIIVLIGVIQKAVGHAIRGKVILYTISGAVLLVYVASLAVLQAERGQPDAHITDFGDAVWWAITTITTVGYGDVYPVTTTGRVIAALLMIGGISLVGSITATIASWIVQTVPAGDPETGELSAGGGTRTHTFFRTRAPKARAYAQFRHARRAPIVQLPPRRNLSEVGHMLVASAVKRGDVRSADEFNRVQALIASGMNDCAIARETAVPRPTVRDWRTRSPNRLRLPGASSPCGVDHEYSVLPPREYAYLLGLYLGGHPRPLHLRTGLSRHPVDPFHPVRRLDLPQGRHRSPRRIHRPQGLSRHYADGST